MSSSYCLRVFSEKLRGWPHSVATHGAIRGNTCTIAIIDEHHGAMLTGVWVPVSGCWEITGDYEGDKLIFNVWVEPDKPEK